MGVALLIPPMFQLQIDTPQEFLSLIAFTFTCSIICALTFASDRRHQELRIAESKWRHSEQWLKAAQQFTRFWTWEIDPERKLVKWVNPYGELRSQVYEPLDNWLMRIDGADRLRWMSALEATRFSNTFELQFRSPGPNGDRYFIAKGLMTDDPATEERRLVGVSVEMTERRTRASESDDAHFALYGVEDLLSNLAGNPSLDRKARRNVDMARDVVRRLLPQETRQHDRVG